MPRMLSNTPNPEHRSCRLDSVPGKLEQRKSSAELALSIGLPAPVHEGFLLTRGEPRFFSRRRPWTKRFFCLFPRIGLNHELRWFEATERHGGKIDVGRQCGALFFEGAEAEVSDDGVLGISVDRKCMLHVQAVDKTDGCTLATWVKALTGKVPAPTLDSERRESEEDVRRLCDWCE